MNMLQQDRPVSMQLRPGSRIRVTAGTVWLTQDGSIEDVVLRAGDEFIVPYRATQVLSAVDGPAFVRIQDIEARARALRRVVLRRLVERIRSAIVRALTGAGAPSSNAG